MIRERLIDAAADAAAAGEDPFDTVRVAEAAARLGLARRARELLAHAEGAGDESWWHAFVARAYAIAGDAEGVARARARLEERWRSSSAGANEVGLLAEAHERLGDEREADAILARTADPGPALMVATSAAARGAFDRAEALASHEGLAAAEYAEDRAAAWIEIGKEAARRGDAARARRILARALDVARELDPWELRVEAIAKIAIALGSTGDTKRARHTARLAEKALPGVDTGYGPTWSVTLADALRAGGHAKRADAILEANERFHAQGPTPGGYAWAAILLAERDDDGGARKRIREAEHALADYTDGDALAELAHVRLVRACALVGDIDRALEHAAAIRRPGERVRALLEAVRP